MALNKHMKDLCGPTEIIPDTLTSEEKTIAESQAADLERKHGPNFLFTPDQEGGKINGQPAEAPILSKLIAAFVKPGNSLVCAFENGCGFPGFVKGLSPNGTSLSYRDVLLEHAVRILPTTDTTYQLSGGSFAGVELSLANQERWQIAKMIRRGFGDVDADVRLLQEGRFISQLPPAVANKFPKVRQEDVVERPDQIGYRMEYCPYPTMAELVLSGHLTPDQIVEALTHIYHSMFEDAYCLPESSDRADDNYFERIDRRMARVLDTSNSIGTKLKPLLKAESLTIDGQEYPGFFPLYEALKANRGHQRLAIPPDHCVAHGDMILEDMLLHPVSGNFKLIDPNGPSSSKYYDIAKTLLSLATKYELFYFNRFRVEQDEKDHTDVHIIFDDPEMAQRYEEMTEGFWDFLESQSNVFFDRDPVWRDRLNLLNALQNLSIVMFHLIHHGKEGRAISFLLMGIKQLSRFFEKQSN